MAMNFFGFLAGFLIKGEVLSCLHEICYSCKEGKQDRNLGQSSTKVRQSNGYCNSEIVIRRPPSNTLPADEKLYVWLS